jgi:hypothetical protein
MSAGFARTPQERLLHNILGVGVGVGEPSRR